MPNMLMGAGNQNPLQPQQPQQMQAPPPSPEKIQEVHQHLSDFQEDLKKLLNMPNDDLTIGKVLDVAAESISRNRETDGKRGTTPEVVAAEISSPDFPPADAPAPVIRKYLMNHFMQSVQAQAQVTKKFGPPMQPGQQPQQQPAPMQLPQNSLNGGQ